VDADGKKRELHIDEALDAINYEAINAKKNYTTHANTRNPVVESKFFTTNFLPLRGSYEASGKTTTFTVFMCVDGNLELHFNDDLWRFSKGDTFLIPASMGVYFLKGEASLLEISV
jgi:mannose-6-phosphate isomerase